jgi:hypothetical protein
MSVCLGGVEDFPASVSLTCCLLLAENRPPHIIRLMVWIMFWKMLKIYVMDTTNFFSTSISQALDKNAKFQEEGTSLFFAAFQWFTISLEAIERTTSPTVQGISSAHHVY